MTECPEKRILPDIVTLHRRRSTGMCRFPSLRMRRFLPLLALPLLLAACSRPAAPAQDSSTLPGKVYAKEGNAYSVSYPDGWRIEEQTTLNTPSGDLTGTAFVPPSANAKDTTLLGANVHVAIQSSCPQIENSQSAIINRYPYRHGSWTDAAAGNLYTGNVYITQYDGKCAVITLFQHLCNLGPDCGPKHSTPFNDAGLRTTFDAMVQSFAWVQP